MAVRTLIHDTCHARPCRLLTTDLSTLSLRLIRMKAALGTQDSLLRILQAQPALLLQDVELDQVGPLPADLALKGAYPQLEICASHLGTAP